MAAGEETVAAQRPVGLFKVGAALIVHEETFISEPSPETFSCGGKPETLSFLLSPEFGAFFSPRNLSKAIFTKVFHSDSDGKEFACNEGDLGSIPGLGRSPGAGNSTHTSILACRIPWTEEPGGLQSMEVSKSQTELSDLACLYKENTFAKGFEAENQSQLGPILQIRARF